MMDPGVSSSTTELLSNNWTRDGDPSQDREESPGRLVDAVEQMRESNPHSQFGRSGMDHGPDQ